jgi:hypothetical protein
MADQPQFREYDGVCLICQRTIDPSACVCCNREIRLGECLPDPYPITVCEHTPAWSSHVLICSSECDDGFEAHVKEMINRVKRLRFIQRGHSPEEWPEPPKFNLGSEQ